MAQLPGSQGRVDLDGLRGLVAEAPDRPVTYGCDVCSVQHEGTMTTAVEFFEAHECGAVMLDVDDESIPLRLDDMPSELADLVRQVARKIDLRTLPPIDELRAAALDIHVEFMQAHQPSDALYRIGQTCWAVLEASHHGREVPRDVLVLAVQNYKWALDQWRAK